MSKQAVLQETDAPVVIDVSVVTPVYNSAKTIEQTVRSVLANKDVSVEIIAVVDGSPDNSAEILRQLQQEIPQLVVMEHDNVGGAKTLNRGLKAARGRYVAFLDGDDWLEEGALDRLVGMCDRDASQIGIGYLVKWTAGVKTHIHDQLALLFTKPLTSITKDGGGQTLFVDSFYTGKLFDRQFLLDHNIWFNPRLLYADRPFVNAAETAASRISTTNDVVGYWRKVKNGNSITDQRATLKNYLDRLASYFDVRDQVWARAPAAIRDKSLIALDRILGPRIFWVIGRLPAFARNTEFFQATQFYLRSIGNSWITARRADRKFNVKRRHRGYMQILRDHSVRSRFQMVLKRLVYLELGLRKSAKELKGKKHFTPDAFPVDPTLVVFESFFGKEYGGQPRYIYEELLTSDKYFKGVWVVNPERATPLDIPGPVIQVKRGSPDYYRYLSRAGFWVNNIRFPVYQKPTGTTYFQTWHGTPLKRLSGDIQMTSGPEVEARKDAIRESRLWDYMLSQNAYSSEIFDRAYELECPVLNAGYPAADALAEMAPGNPELREKLGIPEGKKVVLYAPTWRDTNRQPGQAWKFDFTLPFDPQTLLDALGDDYVLVLRMHHLVTLDLPAEDLGRSVFDASKVDDATQVLGLADVLISDYSSIFFDYAVTGKPMVFFMPDRAAYESEMRGFYLDPDQDLPGPVVDTQDQLLATCRDLDAQTRTYADRYKAFQRTFLSQQDGTAARRIIADVFQNMPEKY